MLQKNISGFILLASSWVFLLVSTSQLSAHEFWLEPINYKIEVGKALRAHEKVGQEFKGNKYAYLASSYESLDLTIGDKSRAVKSRLGDMPAVSEVVNEEGLAILSAVTTPSDVTYKTWEKFSDFIKSKGLDWVLAEHKKRKLPENNFTESYRRYAKSVIKVGHGKGSDRALGLTFEWVLETNPYSSSKNGDDKAIKAQLLWKGKPHPDAYVTVFNKLNGEIIKSELITDSEGRVEIPRAKGGQFLVNAVRMMVAPDKMKAEKNAIWESRWASITYEINVK